MKQAQPMIRRHLVAFVLVCLDVKAQVQVSVHRYGVQRVKRSKGRGPKEVSVPLLAAATS
jgi:hypothetical protein